MPSDDIRVEVEFLPWHGLWTVDETFYMKSNVLEPGPAVVDGFNSLFICEGNEVHTVKLASPPPRDNPDENTYCGWGSVINGHNWIWELPSGWKITSLSGDLNTATNTYEGFDEVKIHSAELGELYKEKIVDIKSSAKKARELIWQVRGNPEFKKKARAVYQLHGSRKRPSFN